MKKLIFFILLGVLFLCAGCSEQPVNSLGNKNIDDSEYLVVEIPFMPGFVEPIMEMEPPDELLNSGDENTDYVSLSEAYYDIYRVKIMWGHMFNNLPDSNYLDMSGSLMITIPGIITVKKTIDFENDDYLIERNDKWPHKIEWVAHITELDSDGLELEIYSAKNYLMTVVPQMLIEIYDQHHAVNFADMVELDTVITLDIYNDLWIRSKKVGPGDCIRGHLGGAWVHKNINYGYFFGKWYAEDYILMGYLGGTFQTDDNGYRTFTGGWCDLGGQFQGYLKGVWEYVNDAVSVKPYPSGKFRGVFSDCNSIIRGHLSGKFGYVLTDDASVTCRPRFTGVWSTCNFAVDNRF